MKVRFRSKPLWLTSIIAAHADNICRYVSLCPFGHRVSSTSDDKREAFREINRRNGTQEALSDVSLQLHKSRPGQYEYTNIICRYEKLLGILRTELLKLPEGEAHWEMATQLLGWLVCAKRPLKWHEMQSILSYDPKHQKVDFDNKMLRQDSHNYLGSLVHILDGGHIRIVHSTARQ